MRKVRLLKLTRNSDFVKWDEDMVTNRDWSSQIFGMSPKLLAFTLNGKQTRSRVHRTYADGDSTRPRTTAHFVGSSARLPSMRFRIVLSQSRVGVSNGDMTTS